MSKYTNALYPDKINDLIDNDGKVKLDSDVASKEYVNDKLSAKITRKKVNELPTTDIDSNTIYLVLNSQSDEENNIYNEYMYIDNKWELIGTTKAEIELFTLELDFEETQGTITQEQYNSLDINSTIIYGTYIFKATFYGDGIFLFAQNQGSYLGVIGIGYDDETQEYVWQYTMTPLIDGFPSTPSDTTKTYTLKCINGTTQWVEEA